MPAGVTVSLQRFAERQSALAIQLAGLGLLETLTHDLVRMGMGNTNAKVAKQIEEQAKQLGNYYIRGIQSQLRELTLRFRAEDNREAAYPVALFFPLRFVAFGAGASAAAALSRGFCARAACRFRASAR